jgi:NAD-binding of NADP-dependent 3-hydroxyisobutyrate dehydrogenase
VTAGPKDTTDYCQPLFTAIAGRVIETGPDPASATAVKLANNFVVACAIEAMSESFALVRKYGVPPEVFYGVLTDGLFACGAYKAYGKIIAEERYLPAGHTHALVFLVAFPRDPTCDEPGAEWIVGLQRWRAALRSAETATVLANYLRILGYDACSHSATTTDVDLNRLAVSAGVALVDDDGVVANPFVGPRFALAVVTTNLELAPDAPLRRQGFADVLHAKGAAWWTGAAAPKNARNSLDFARRNFKDSRYPVERLKRTDKPTTFIDEERIPRSPKSSEFFLRAAFGDIGKAAQDASKDGYSVAKAPLAAALRLALNVYSLLQRGEPATRRAPSCEDSQRNADMVKAAMHFLGADLAGISRAPAWVWYSHRQDGTEMPVAHPRAVSVMIDQGYETMEGASGDDWISSAQSMRTYMRAGLVCGVVGQHLRNLGFSATAHSAADSDVIQTPLVLLAGLGEVSRIGDIIPQSVSRAKAEDWHPYDRSADGGRQADRLRPSELLRCLQQVRTRMSVGRDLCRPKSDVQRLRDLESRRREMHALSHDQHGWVDVRALHEDLPMEPCWPGSRGAVPLGGNESAGCGEMDRSFRRLAQSRPHQSNQKMVVGYCQ